MSLTHAVLDVNETGRRLGHDLFRFRKPVSERQMPDSIREGLAHAAARGVRPEPADRFVKKWLQLRLSAYQRSRAFDEAVTPAFIRAIDVASCAVLRIPLTHGENKDSDWSVDRLNNDGAYAANNLAVISARANMAKGARSFDEVHALAQQREASAGLQPVEWMRLAALMLGPCFAAQPSRVPSIPLAAPIPNHTVRLAMQQIQHLFTLNARSQCGKNQLIKHFRAACSGERSAMRLRDFAEAVHAGLKGLPHAHDVWLRPGVMDALLAWRETLSSQAWAVAGAVSGSLANSRVLPQASLSSWRLDRRGYDN